MCVASRPPLLVAGVLIVIGEAPRSVNAWSFGQGAECSFVFHHYVGSIQLLHLGSANCLSDSEWESGRHNWKIKIRSQINFTIDLNQYEIYVILRVYKQKSCWELAKAVDHSPMINKLLTQQEPCIHKLISNKKPFKHISKLNLSSVSLSGGRGEYHTCVFLLLWNFLPSPIETKTQS